MIKKYYLLLFLCSSSFAFAYELVVTPAMIVSGGITIKSPVVTKITFAEGDYTALEDLEISHNPILSSLVIPETLTNLTDLIVSDNPLLSSLLVPETLSSLKILTVSQNSLVSFSVPENLSSLEVLEICRNPFLSTLTVPKTLTDLKYLRIAYNSILSSLTIHALMLESIHVSHNPQLTSIIVPGILTALKFLTVSHSPLLSSYDLLRHLTALGSLSAMEVLGLSYNLFLFQNLSSIVPRKVNSSFYSQGSDIEIISYTNYVK